MKSKDNVFPDDFLWGASISTYQVEGGNHNQWSEWEHAQAAKLAATAKARLEWLPNWTEIAHQAEEPANYVSGDGVDHYHQYAADFALLSELNCNAFRCGLEWSRLQPEPDTWNSAAVQHYHDYFAALKARGITPIVTLWHWTMPVWFTDRGGFEKRANVKLFVQYVDKVMQEFGTECNYVITLNEPNVYATFSYLSGEWPPQAKRPARFLAVYKNLARAHNQAYEVIKRYNPDARVGIAAQLSHNLPSSPRNPINRFVISGYSYAWNWWFMNRVHKQSDFIGLNYYFTSYINWRGQSKNPPQPVNDLGWYMNPQGILPVIQQLWRRYKKPIMITENGLADAKDTHRKWWLEETVGALSAAINSGVTVHGYLHWSLLDNFEWAYGWWPKFGLIAVDHKTQKRTVRPSAHWYADFLKRAGN